MTPPRHIDVAAVFLAILWAAAIAYAITMLLK